MTRNDGDIPHHILDVFRNVTLSFIEKTAPVFDRVEASRIHGDCHIKNILFRPGEGMMLIDFDDMMTGPQVQDLWLFLQGATDECRRELDLLLDGYELFMEFDYYGLKLIESLRAMRIIHFLAWCCRQKNDALFRKTFPEWGAAKFWDAEMRELAMQIDSALKKIE